MSEFKETVQEYVGKEIPENTKIMAYTNQITRSEERSINFVSIPIVHKKIIIEWSEVEKREKE